MDQSDRDEILRLVREAAREAVADAIVTMGLRPPKREAAKVDLWTDRISRWLDTQTGPVTTADVARGALDLDACPRSAATRIGMTLRRLGWAPHQRALCDQYGAVTRVERAYTKAPRKAAETSAANVQPWDGQSVPTAAQVALYARTVPGPGHAGYDAELEARAVDAGLR